MKRLPKPYTAVFQDWSDDPFGAGWHAWKAGVCFDKVMPRVRQPAEKESVSICGEACCRRRCLDFFASRAQLFSRDVWSLRRLNAAGRKEISFCLVERHMN
jgi:hypothetical protein